MVCRNHRIKRAPCRSLDGHVKEPYEKSMAFGAQPLGYCFTLYQRLWLYNGATLVAFYDTLGIQRTYSRLKPPASSRGWSLIVCPTSSSFRLHSYMPSHDHLIVTLNNQFNSTQLNSRSSKSVCKKVSWAKVPECTCSYQTLSYLGHCLDERIGPSERARSRWPNVQQMHCCNDVL